MSRRSSARAVVVTLAAAIALVAASVAGSAVGNAYTVHPLVSTATDATLVNAWGLVSGPGTPWWVSDNGTDKSTLYRADGTKVPLTVSVDGGPTGVVFNQAGTGFPVGVGPALFIWSSEDGAIRAWNQTTGTTAMVTVPSSGGEYKGLTYAVAATGPQIYATDFGKGNVDVFDAAWHPVTTTGGFVDSSLPKGYAPFGIQSVGSWIVVTFAKQAGNGDEVDGQGLGFVDAFDLNGVLVGRVAQHGQLNAPWGIAMAPPTFGRFGGDLLVGNFGDGQINAYAQQANGQFTPQGTLRDASGGKLAIDGLWALQFGHGPANNGPTDTLFFTAGPDGEHAGLFGSITAG
jgi:uncharacterized protein (TIGR03118 family)